MSTALPKGEGNIAQVFDREMVNDDLTALLSPQWVAETEDDYDRLNDLTHEVADLLDQFMADGARS